jgi:hypothetical protein
VVIPDAPQLLRSAVVEEPEINADGKLVKLAKPVP